MYEERLNRAFSRITADSELKDRTLERIDNMNKKTMKRTRKAAGALICAAAIGITTVFAASPIGREAIGGIIDYFASDKAREITSMEELSRHNEAIGESVSKNGITLTLDNVAADDNFVHVFYTVKLPETFDTRTGYLNIESIIDGEIGISGNNNSHENYFADDSAVKGVMKINVSTRSLPDKFKLELLMAYDETGNDIISAQYMKNSNGERAELSEDDKSGLLYISTDIDKSAVSVESVVKEINKKTSERTEIEKIIFSPFGNQMVLTYDTRGLDEGGEAGSAVFNDNFALFDENGTCLDVLNTDLMSVENGIGRNSFEFLKADKNLKSITFVPVKITPSYEDMPVIRQKTGVYPLTYETNKYGKVVVTGIRFKDGEILIDYYKDGYVMYDPGFVLENDAGENVEPGGKFNCILYTDVHYETNSYTARYVYAPLDENGNVLPPDESVSADKLEASLTTLGVVENKGVELDFDNAVILDVD